MDAIGAAELALAGGVATGVGVGAALAAGAEAAPPPQAVTADVNPSPSAPAMVSMRLRQRCPQPGSELFCTNFFIELPIWCGNDPPNFVPNARIEMKSKPKTQFRATFGPCRGKWEPWSCWFMACSPPAPARKVRPRNLQKVPQTSPRRTGRQPRPPRPIWVPLRGTPLIPPRDRYQSVLFGMRLCCSRLTSKPFTSIPPEKANMTGCRRRTSYSLPTTILITSIKSKLTPLDNRPQRSSGLRML